MIEAAKLEATLVNAQKEAKELQEILGKIASRLSINSSRKALLEPSAQASRAIISQLSSSQQLLSEKDKESFRIAESNLSTTNTELKQLELERLSILEDQSHVSSKLALVLDDINYIKQNIRTEKSFGLSVSINVLKTLLKPFTSSTTPKLVNPETGKEISLAEDFDTAPNNWLSLIIETIKRNPKISTIKINAAGLRINEASQALSAGAEESINAADTSMTSTGSSGAAGSPQKASSLATIMQALKEAEEHHTARAAARGGAGVGRMADHEESLITDDTHDLPDLFVRALSNLNKPWPTQRSELRAPQLQSINLSYNDLTSRQVKAIITELQFSHLKLFGNVPALSLSDTSFMTHTGEQKHRLLLVFATPERNCPPKFAEINFTPIDLASHSLSERLSRSSRSASTRPSSSFLPHEERSQYLGLGVVYLSSPEISSTDLIAGKYSSYLYGHQKANQAAIYDAEHMAAIIDAYSKTGRIPPDSVNKDAAARKELSLTLRQLSDIRAENDQKARQKIIYDAARKVLTHMLQVEKMSYNQIMQTEPFRKFPTDLQKLIKETAEAVNIINAILPALTSLDESARLEELKRIQDSNEFKALPPADKQAIQLAIIKLSLAASKPAQTEPELPRGGSGGAASGSSPSQPVAQEAMLAVPTTAAAVAAVPAPSRHLLSPAARPTPLQSRAAAPATAQATTSTQRRTVASAPVTAPAGPVNFAAAAANIGKRLQATDRVSPPTANNELPPSESTRLLTQTAMRSASINNGGNLTPTKLSQAESGPKTPFLEQRTEARSTGMARDSSAAGASAVRRLEPAEAPRRKLNIDNDARSCPADPACTDPYTGGWTCCPWLGAATEEQKQAMGYLDETGAAKD
ncbi:MAG: hypothetical protein K0Q57_618 [Gammaproteobacteria bacterium]|nr:hypothetical protein [Gammaproteobacteria bacterium]